MTTLPTGTVTFLMTDIEGSTRLTARAGAEFARLLDEHFALLDASVNGNGGTVVSSEGDALFAVFPAARQAIAAAIEAQRALEAHDWPADRTIKVRMGIHAGEAVFGGRDYTGLEVHRTARIASAAWGGQILVSDAIRVLAGENLPDGASLRDLGRHGLKDLPAPEQLYQLCAPGLQTDFPAPRALTVVSGNLPQPLTRFVGRRRELAEVSGLLESGRLVTMTGPGGTGKTRLAIETARSLAGEYHDGVWFVALETVRDPELVLPAVAQTLGVAEQPGRDIVDLLTEHLAKGRWLIVLDNLEQVAAAAPRIGALLGATAELSLLGSSREPLGIAGERVYPVPTLGLPAESGQPAAADLAASESVELFVERARAVRPNFQLTDDNAPAVAGICRRLDGLPLAIELAAARVNVLAPAQILARLDHRLNLVASTRRDLPDRQRTLRGAIEWSYELLDEPERVVFRRFSIFAGGASLEALLAVVDPQGELPTDLLDLLARLVDRSLIRSQQDAGEARFEMLETIREYADDKLAEAGEREAIGDRHAAHYTDVAEASSDVLTRPDRDAVLDQLDREMPNLRAALAWTIARRDFATAYRLTVALKDFLRTRGHLREALATIDRLLEVSADEPAGAERARVLGVGAELSAWRGEYARTQSFNDRWIAMLETLGDHVGVAVAMGTVGWANIGQRPDVARAAFEKALAVEKSDDATLMGNLQGLSLAHLQLGNIDEAAAAAQASIAAGERAGDEYGNSFNYVSMGAVGFVRADLREAGRWFGQALDKMSAAQSPMGVGVALDGVATLAIEFGDPLVATRLAAGAERLRQEIGGAPSVELAGIEPPLQRTLGLLPATEYEQALREGRALALADAVELARSVIERAAG